MATISDRGATEHKCNELLKEYRNKILPVVIENYGKMSEADGKPLTNMYNFFCALHSMVHIAECANNSIPEAEKGLADPVQQKEPMQNRSNMQMNQEQQDSSELPVKHWQREVMRSLGAMGHSVRMCNDS